jgi:DNA repair exonuclease SbcCD ATPase subunit
MDVDNLGPGPDLDTIDFAKLDKGDSLSPPTPPEQPAAEEASLAEQQEAQPEQPAPTGEETPPKEDDQPRDEKTGKFRKKEIPDHVPRERMKEAVDKEREAREQAEKRAQELERQLREREAREQQQVQRSEAVRQLDAQVEALEAEREQAAYDGNKEKAQELSKQVRELNRRIARIEAQEESTQIVSETLEKERLQVAIAECEARYPMLNHRSETYNEKMTEVVLATQFMKIQQGMPRSQALYEAVRTVMEGLQPQREEVPKGLEHAQESAKEQTQERRKEQVQTSLATQNAQPPSLQTVGLDSDKAGATGLPDVTRMSVEEFDALPESTRARLRGDLI